MFSYLFGKKKTPKVPFTPPDNIVTKLVSILTEEVDITSTVDISTIQYYLEWASQNEEIQKKQEKSCFTFKDYTLPSGKIIRVQGYEPLALDILLETITEEDLLTGYKNVPIIWYEINDNKHRYFTDIFIPSHNKCIEVKSDFTFYKDYEKNLLKQEATKLLGFECEIWIFNDKKKLIEVLT
jgi:ligand-binding SRPBCC domain-containing protein